MERAAGATCDVDALSFRVSDPDRRLAGVRLYPGASLPGYGLDFERSEGEWRLRIPRPPAWRLEYLLELRHHDGGHELVCDPENPDRVGGAFGDKSVVVCPEYTEPDWLHMPAAPGYWREAVLPAHPLRAEVHARIWSPENVHTGRLLLANDGPEYDHRAALSHYSAASIAAGRVPPHHLVLLSPGDRNEWYSANPAYAWAYAADIVPRLHADLGIAPAPIIAMGASLGGLALLHTHWRHPKVFAGLFLQSGSFFRPRHDIHESGFRRYLRIVRFCGRVSRAETGPNPIPIVMTCGRAEENLKNNREMARSLRRLGYPVQLHEAPDAHNYTGWRDALHPYLTDLLRSVWTQERVNT
jgi:enterochelin esterase-like enzyme